jgi:hypothetical protein
MANAEKLRETVAVIRQNLTRWDQDDYAKGTVNPAAEDWTECGTTYCLFGWRCVLDGLRPIHDVETDDYGVEHIVAIGGFYDPTRPLAYDNYISPQQYGRKVFDLTYHEARMLSMYFTDDIDAFEARVESVIVGDVIEDDDA